MAVIDSKNVVICNTEVNNTLISKKPRLFYIEITNNAKLSEKWIKHLVVNNEACDIKY